MSLSKERMNKQVASMGGKARARKLTPERRREIARKAVATRWGLPGAVWKDASKTALKHFNVEVQLSRKSRKPKAKSNPLVMWIVMEYIGQWWRADQKTTDKPLACCDFVGLFATEDEARSACYNKCCFIGPATVGKRLPKARVPWPGAYYPRLTRKNAQQRPHNRSRHHSRAASGGGCRVSKAR